MGLNKNGPPAENSFKAFVAKIDFNVPMGYLEFMKNSDGAEGFLNDSYLILWSVEEIFDNNRDYQVEEFAPDFFIIGSNGGGETFAIEKQTGKLYMTPFITMSREDAIYKADNFEDFIKALDRDDSN